MTLNYEFTEREISALHRENVGPHYHRINYVKDLAMEARIDAALQWHESLPTLKRIY